MTDVYCFGSAHIDKIVTFYQQPAEGHAIPASSEVSFGGVGQNMALTLNRLGNKVGIVSLIGKDSDGDAIIKNLEDRQIDYQGIQRTSDHPTGTYMGFYRPNGELYIAAADMDIYDEFKPAMLIPIIEDFKDAKAWVTDCAFKPELFEVVAKARGDLDLYVTVTSVPKADKIKPLLKETKALFGNVEEMLYLADVGGHDDESIWKCIDILTKQGVESVFATKGGAGVYVYTNGVRYRCPAIPASIKCVNGAGDSFASGVINANLAGKSDLDAIESGLASAALCLEGTEITSENIAGKVSSLSFDRSKVIV